MAIAYTPRLGLSKPDSDEFQLVGVLNGNDDILDQMIGARIVADNVVPPANQLYDGCFVHEKTSKRSWIAVANGAGGFDKHYLASPSVLYQVPIRAASNLDNLINAPGSNNGFTDPYNRGTVAWNRLFHISWAFTVTVVQTAGNLIQGEAWFNGASVAYDRHTASTSTYSNECYVSCPAGTAALFQGVVSKVAGTGTITVTNDPRFTHFQFTEAAMP